MTKIKTFKNNDDVAFAGEVIRETEKAVLVRVAGLYRGHKDVWLPKSQVEIGRRHIFCKMWLVAAKARESAADFCTMLPKLAREAECEIAA